MRTFIGVSHPEMLPRGVRWSLDGTVVSDAMSLQYAIMASHEQASGADGNPLRVDSRGGATRCRCLGRARIYGDDGGDLCLGEVFVDAHRIMEG